MFKLGKRIDQAGRFIGTRILVKGEAWIGPTGVKAERALFDVPAVVAPGDDHVDFLEIVLADVADVKIAGFDIKCSVQNYEQWIFDFYF